MGYRNYLGILDKTLTKELQRKSYTELRKEYRINNEEVGFYSLPVETVFEFGKLYWDDIGEKIYAIGKPFFNKRIQNKFEYYQPYIVTREAIKIAIDGYIKNIITYYQGLFKSDIKLYNKFSNIEIADTPADVLSGCVNHCRDILNMWDTSWSKFGSDVINLDDNTENLTNSWLYEYSIFDLVRLYKTLDFNKYDLVFYGW